MCDVDLPNHLSATDVAYFMPVHVERWYGILREGHTAVGGQRNMCVISWYTGGTSVVDFSNPLTPKEVAYFMPDDADVWSAYFHRVIDRVMCSTCQSFVVG